MSDMIIAFKNCDSKIMSISDVVDYEDLDKELWLATDSNYSKSEYYIPFKNILYYQLTHKKEGDKDDKIEQNLQGTL